jgi:hypothetical protein
MHAMFTGILNLIWLIERTLKMALNLAQIREKLLAQQSNKERGSNVSRGDNASYPFWSNPEGSTAVLRFLPDGDTTNDFFWVERLIIKLPFSGIKGDNQSRPTEVQVPCMDMWKAGSCPINAEIRPWWKGGKDLEDMARKYWRKKSFLFQGFVRQNPNAEDAANAPENPIRRFVINPSVFDRIKTVFMDQEVENSPVEYDRGLDFRLVKGTKGQYADYGQSAWARRESALTEQELAAIDAHGLFNLSQHLPKKPDDDQLKAIMDMFHDSVDGKPYDPDKYGQYYKPYGLKLDTDNTSTAPREEVTRSSVPTRNMSVKAPATAPDDVDVPFDVAPATRTEVPVSEPKKLTNPQDILAAIRRKQQAG